MAARRELYPPIDPYTEGFLEVGDGHRVHYEVCGNPAGTPVVFVHGGPGAGCAPSARCFFDPVAYKIVLFDQRGCGKSTPFAGLDRNTTWDLVRDMELLRKAVDVERWVVFGGSWGCTLALAYAETHPERVRALILRGVCMLRQREIRWLYQEGASFIFPDAWESYIEPIPVEERGDILAAYFKRLTSDDAKVKPHRSPIFAPLVRQARAARSWWAWEAQVSKFQVDAAREEPGTEDALALFAVAIARIECHYFVNRAFFEVDDQLLRDAGRIRHIPTVIVQGRYDVVCPTTSAWDLHRALPEAELNVIPDAGHSALEPGTLSALVDATDRFRAAA